MNTKQLLKFSAITSIAIVGPACGARMIERSADESGAGGASGASSAAPTSNSPAPMGKGGTAPTPGGSRPGKGGGSASPNDVGDAGAAGAGEAGTTGRGGGPSEGGGPSKGGEGGAPSKGGEGGALSKGGAGGALGEAGEAGRSGEGGALGKGGGSSDGGALGKGGAPSFGGGLGKGGAPSFGGGFGKGGSPGFGGGGGVLSFGGAAGDSAGSGGQGGFAPAPKCAALTFAPSTPLLTDTFGSVAIPSAIYKYSASGLAPATTEVLTASNATFAGIHIKAAPGLATDLMTNWLGVGLPLAGCVDASAYRGVQFTITGDLGGCAVSFGLVTSVNNSDSFGGSCQGSNCFANTAGPLKLGKSTILFADMTGGSPEPHVNPATLNDLQWQFTVPTDASAPACVADFTVTEISFVP